MKAELNTARQVFEEQIAAFALRLNLVGTERYDDLRAEEHYRAFTVAGAMKADLLADLHEAVRKAVVDGGTIQDFRKDFDRIVERHGWHGWTGEGTKLGEAWRTRVIYQTNTRKAYSAGRYAQLTDPAVVAVLPYWRWVHSGTANDPRPEHLAWHGMTLHHSHPFWQTHFPPRIPPDWGCGCRVEAVRAPATDAPTEPPAGWEDAAAIGDGVAPPADVVAAIRELVADKRARLPPELSRAFGEVVDSYVLGSRGPLPLAAATAATATTAATAAADAAAMSFSESAMAERRAKQPPHVLGEPSPTLLAAAASIGMTLEGRMLALDHDYTVHIMDSHAGAEEALRGQIPVSAADLALLAWVFGGEVALRRGEPPHARNGAPRIVAVVTVDGVLWEVVLEVRRKVLVPTTLWKRLAKPA